MRQPDSTAVTVALWRAAHVILDEPPHVLEDSIGLRLAYHADVLRAASFHVDDDAPVDAPGEGWLSEPRMVGPMQERWRASVVARSRFVEDLVVEGGGTHGVEQYVILGAGLDSLALRRPDLAPRLQVFEVDEPGTQAWKRERLKEVGLPVPAHLRFAPVDFESGESWVEKIVAAGFNPERPAVVGSLGVTQYITREATLEMMRLSAGLAPGTTLVCSFILPMERIAAEEREWRALGEERVAARGHPWIGSYGEDEFAAMANEAGFSTVRQVSADELRQLYFSERPDGLRPAGSEHLIVASGGRSVVART